MTVLVVLGLLGGVSAGALAASPKSASVQPRGSSCDVAYSLTSVNRSQRELLGEACERGPKATAETYGAIFRLVSSSGWHAGFVGTILRRHGLSAFTAWADGASHDPPEAVAVQSKLDAGLSSFAAGTRCAELRGSEELASFLDALGADEEPEELPFTSAFAACLGVPSASMEGIRLLTIRADGLDDVTVVIGTRDFVHARRFTRGDALHLGNHRFFIVAVPEASPLTVLANHDNQELPVIWRGLVGRNTVIWAIPPRRSCLDLSVEMNPGTHLYLDGVRVGGGGAEQEVCSQDPDVVASPTVDRTISLTLDRPRVGLPDHEIAAMACEGGRPIVRHLSPIRASAAAEDLRRTSECETLRLDLSTPTRERIAVLGVTKMPGCEVTPLWATDIQERIRHILGSDVAHGEERSYANFSAYAEASEALSSLQTSLGGDRGDDETSSQRTDANVLLGSAAQEAWRQGIDTLLSFALQCSPRGKDALGDPQWAYSLRVTSIKVSELFARGYYGREGLDLEDFIAVESVGFMTARQQDASVGALLDRVFSVPRPRLHAAPTDKPYRDTQTLRVSRYFATGPPGDAMVPEQVSAYYKPLDRRSDSKNGAAWRRFWALRPERPRICDRLAHRGARRPEAIEAATLVYRELGGEGHELELRRSRDEFDLSSNPQATVFDGEMSPPRPGWYLVMVEGSEGEIADAVCINATAHAADLWAELSISGGPLAFAINDSKSLFYLRPRLGATRYSAWRWLGFGATLGYGFTQYAGTRGDWKDLGVSVQERLVWNRHALLFGPHVEFRRRKTKSPVEYRARLGVVLDAGLVTIGGVDSGLTEFRAGNVDDVLLDIDGDLNLDLSVGRPLGPVQLQGLVMFSYVAIDDSLRRSSTSVTEDANLYLGFGFAVSGGRR